MIRGTQTTDGSHGDGPRNKRNPSKNLPREGQYTIGPNGSLQAMAPNEARMAINSAFTRIFPRDRSLEGFTGEPACKYAPLGCIEFHAYLGFTMDILKSVTNRGMSSTCLNSLPLYHGHVLWNCLPRMTVVDGEYEFSLVHKGPNLSPQTGVDHGGRSPPSIVSGLLMLSINEELLVSKLVPTARGNEIVFDKKFRLADFEKAKDGVVFMNIVFYVHPSYFDLATIIDLDASPPTVPDVMADTVAKALRGEKSDGADWTITVAERDFFVHSEAFASKSKPIQNILNNGPKAMKCILSGLTAEDMQVVIPLIYGAAVPLPRDDARFIPLVDAIRGIFNADYLQSFLAPQWERHICKRAIALPLTVSSFFPAFRLLTIVWCFPKGWMPVAKRVAIGVMADIVHLHAGDNLNAFIHGQAAEIVPLLKEKDLDHWLAIMDSMVMHLYMVSSVLKNGPGRGDERMNENSDQKEEKEQVVENVNKIDPADPLKGEFHLSFEDDNCPDEAKTRDEPVKEEESNPAPAFPKESKKAVVPSVEDEEEWHDEDTHGSFNPADPKCKCAIS